MIFFFLIVIYGLFPSRPYFNHRFPADVSEKNNAVSQRLLANILLAPPSPPVWEQQEFVSMLLSFQVTCLSRVRSESCNSSCMEGFTGTPALSERCLHRESAEQQEQGRDGY